MGPLGWALKRMQKKKAGGPVGATWVDVYASAEWRLTFLTCRGRCPALPLTFRQRVSSGMWHSWLAFFATRIVACFPVSLARASHCPSRGPVKQNGDAPQY